MLETTRLLAEREMIGYPEVREAIPSNMKKVTGMIRSQTGTKQMMSSNIVVFLTMS